MRRHALVVISATIAIRAFQQGDDPPGLVWVPNENDFSDLYCISGPIPLEASWRALLA